MSPLCRPIRGMDGLVEAPAIREDVYSMMRTTKMSPPILKLATQAWEHCVLGAEVYGRWSRSCIRLVPQLARQHAKGLHPRIRRGTALAFQNRWWGILSIALQKSVAQAVLRDAGEDLAEACLDDAPGLCDLPVQ